MQKKKLAMLLALMVTFSMATVSVAATEDTEPSCSHTNTSTVTNDATCTVDGSTVVACDDCGEEISNTPISATGHTGGTATCTAQAECDTCGEAYGDALGHTWGEWNTETEATCHSVGSKTRECTVDGCDGSETEEIPTIAHTWSEWETTLEPTCTENGTKTRECTADGCDATEEETIEATGHTVDEWVTIDPSCYADGSKTGTCSDCGEVTEVIPATGNHTFEGDYVLNDNGTHQRHCTTDGCDALSEAEECDNDDSDCVCGREMLTSDEETIDPIDPVKPSDPSDKDDNDGSNSGSGSSSSSDKKDDAEKPDAKTQSINTIKGAKYGDIVRVELPEGSNIIPAEYLTEAAKVNASIVIDYGSYKWVISDIKTGKAVDLSIDKNASYLVEQTALRGLKGDNSNVIDIKHDGELGFKATLKYNVKKANAGKYVNLYFYNPETKTFKLEDTAKIGTDGVANLTFTHCSTYVLNITDEPMDLSAGESAEIVTEALPEVAEPSVAETVATEKAENPKTGTSSMALLAIPAALASAVTIFRKKK